MSTHEQTFIIVGASLAGAKAAETLRAEGFDGRLVLAGAESERPYERPPLTKAYLRSEVPREDAYVHPQPFYREREIELMVETTVTGIDPARARVAFGDGAELGYDRLLLATGATPRRLTVPGAELDGIHYLRTLEDCDTLRERLATSGAKVAVIGAGWIGAEFAASARERGADVTMIDPASVPLERVLGPEVGAVFGDAHRSRGVELVQGTTVEAFEGDGCVRGVRTGGGRTIDCDFAVVGIGVIPRVELAAAAGLTIDDGIQVDQRLTTSDPRIYAAGDVARAWHPFYERFIRVEHWANAINQGPAAARAMLGQDVSYDRIPYFFSDQYDLGMEYSGFATEWDDVLVRGDLANREFVAFWLSNQRVVAGMNVNVWDVNEHVQALIRSRETVDPRALADAEIPLSALAELVGS